MPILPRRWRLLIVLGSLFLPGVAPAAETIYYYYDTLGRVLSAPSYGTVNNNVEPSYRYDPAGNRTNAAVIGAASRVVVLPLSGFTIIPIPDP